MLSTIKELGVKVDSLPQQHPPANLQDMIRTAIHELKLNVNHELGAIQQNLTQELANGLLKIESNHKNGEE
eukprot:2541483-Rhodomonas_salina.1